jgi:hypothetical protein
MTLNIPREQLPTDLEAAFHLSKCPAAGGSFSSALEQVQLNDQPNIRRKMKPKAPPNPTERRIPVLFDKLHQQLEDAQRHHCLFLCWDEGPNDQRVIPLLIKDPEDEKRVYQDMGRIWYERHGRWRRYLPFYGVLSLHEVEVRTRLASIICAD